MKGDSIETEADLARLAFDLLRGDLKRLTSPERKLVSGGKQTSRTLLAATRTGIERGEDPLGTAFTTLRSPDVRRPAGATYTPPTLVNAMVEWVAGRNPARVVDPGAGSGRFLVAAGRALPKAELVAVELDPLAALLCRAHLEAAGLGKRSAVHLVSYLDFSLPKVKGSTAFLGNPPYVRHHQIGRLEKEKLAKSAKSFGLTASQLAGLHVHFYLATAQLALPGDFGSFVTSSEWLDVNYGSVVRRLLTGPLGLEGLHLLDPTALPFDDAATTAVIARFSTGTTPPKVRFSRAKSLEKLGSLETVGRLVPRERFETSRWSSLGENPPKAPRGYVELGELCRVHRGQVTGANKVWIAGEHSHDVPASRLFPTITKARDLFAAGVLLDDSKKLRRVIDLPVDLDELPNEERKAVLKFLRIAKKMGADKGFIAEHRRAWWAIGLRQPAPILATYMARRPPAFVRNLVGARHINIAHGLYPRDDLAPLVLDRLAKFLSGSTSLASGRTYAGGLTKFEPKEMERLLVPSPDLLLSMKL